MNWELINNKIQGSYLLKNKEFSDTRGSFSETYKESAFNEIGLPRMRQDNHLVTARGGIRAMHWQDGEYAQAKLINVIEGTIFDVIYDLRKESPTFGMFETFELNQNSPMLFVPAGCAHGFQAISITSVVHYKTDKEYNFESQRSFRWNDPDVNIPWPISDEAIVSEKDAIAPLLKDINA